MTKRRRIIGASVLACSLSLLIVYVILASRRETPKVMSSCKLRTIGVAALLQPAVPATRSATRPTTRSVDAPEAVELPHDP